MAKLKKSIVFLTNFWDAEALVDVKYVFLKDGDGICKLNFIQDEDGKPVNYNIYSIALSHPDFKTLPNVSNAYRGCLDFFCPTYKLLNRYKSDKNWATYVKDYRDILRNRKEEIVNWINSLDPNIIHVLCCWENTVGASHCHREIIHEAFLKSELGRNKIHPLYRHGKRMFKKKGLMEKIKKVNRISTSSSPNVPYTNVPYTMGVDDAIPDADRTVIVGINEATGELVRQAFGREMEIIDIENYEEFEEEMDEVLSATLIDEDYD